MHERCPLDFGRIQCHVRPAVFADRWNIGIGARPFYGLGARFCVARGLTIVFDARGSHEWESECPSAVRVIYGTEPLDADGTILALIRQTKPSERSRLTVVTRDFLLRDRIFSYGSVVISPEVFELECQRHSKAEQGETSHKIEGNFYRPFKDFFEQKTCKIKVNGR